MVTDQMQPFQWRRGALGAMIGVAITGLPAHASEKTMIRVGVRSDAAPFSEQVAAAYPGLETGHCGDETPLVTYRGYSVDLCRDFIGHLQTQYPEKLDYCFVEVATHRNRALPNRFDALRNGKIDMLCGATTATLEVQSAFRTSLLTFLSTSTFLYNGRSVADRVRDQVPLRIGVLANSTSDETQNPDAETQQAGVRAVLGSVGVAPPVMFDSHADVAEMLCNPNREGTGCAGTRPDTESPAAAENADAAGDERRGVGAEDGGASVALAGVAASTSCAWQWNRSLADWWGYRKCTRWWAHATDMVASLEAQLVALVADDAVAPPGEIASDAGSAPGATETEDRDTADPPTSEHAQAGSGQPDTPAVDGSAAPAPSTSRPAEDDTDAQNASDKVTTAPNEPTPVAFQQRRADREIDVYISDRPILEEILRRAEAENKDAGIALSTEALIPQPYAIVFPVAAVAAQTPAAAFGDLHLDFNRFLVEQVYAPRQRTALNNRLAKYFATTVDRSFINMLPVLAQWPTGAALETHDGAATPAD